jgi:hypothetical protein
MKLTFEVIRHRLSVTQGEAEVKVNGQTVVRYGDTIDIGGTIDPSGGWGSVYSDAHFIEAAMRQYSGEIVSRVVKERDICMKYQQMRTPELKFADAWLEKEKYTEFYKIVYIDDEGRKNWSYAPRKDRIAALQMMLDEITRQEQEANAYHPFVSIERTL